MKHRFLALLCALALLLTACAFDPEDEPAPGDDTPLAPSLSADDPGDEAPSLPDALVLPLLAGITLDPVTCPDGVQQTVGALVYEGLFALDEHFAVQNVLCEQYTYNAAKRTYRFTLKDGITFSNGSKLRASDVLATYQRAAASARYGARFAWVESMRVSSGELVITLTRDDASFPALLDIPIVRSGSESSTFPLGTGPYVPVQDSDGALSLTLREGAQSALPGRIALFPVKDNEAAAYRFSTGAVNLLFADLSAASVSATAGADRTDAPTDALLFLGYNHENSLLARSDVRRALDLSFDRDDAAAKVYAGRALAAQFAVSPASALYPASLLRDTGAAAGQAAWQALSLDASPAPLTLLVNEESSFKLSLARWVCSRLAALGLTVTIRALPWEDYLAALDAGDFDLYLGEVRLGAAWDVGALLRERVVTLLDPPAADPPADPAAEPAEPTVLITGGTLNFGCYANVTAEALLDAYLASPDAEHMLALARQIQTTVPFSPLLFKSTTLLTPSGFLENAAPTAADPFAHGEQWTLHFAQD